ncbi:MAG: hypothetical protein QF921_04280 [Pseudomonadales bacterium]|nr:hypothetical protein [Pseudomonadales bacterium]MDP6471066.1 hypothetical protein [Pseudomonadales bacterium]MDP6825748.1 hypothetical protein [Pseudomonadales bacterium]MDP6970719.1 hypothetical protein [Pseudomonadales bacterium]
MFSPTMLAGAAVLFIAVAGHAGTPDLNGIWQAVGSAHWNVEPHVASAAPITESGALGAAPAGLGVVEGGWIPYRDHARTVRDDNFEHRTERDPAVNCYMPGVPRATYMPLPFQILQTPGHVFIAYEFAGASRTVHLDQPDLEAPASSWMGHSLGRWEGETLVVDVTDQVGETWLDRAGNHHSDALHVEERFTRTGPDHLLYEATLTDPNVYKRPWTLRLPLYRRIEPNVQLLDFRCVEFVEQLMYGHLTRQPEESQ